MEIKTFVKGREVLASGVIHILGNSPVDFHINGMPMQIRFLEDINQPTARYESKVENNAWILNLTNFSVSFGEGLYEPIPVSMIEGKQLSLAFTVATANRAQGVRVFTYTFLYG